MGSLLINFESKSYPKDLLIGPWEKWKSQKSLLKSCSKQPREQSCCLLRWEKLRNKQVWGRLKFGLLCLTCCTDNDYWTSIWKWGSRKTSLELRSIACLKTLESSSPFIHPFQPVTKHCRFHSHIVQLQIAKGKVQVFLIDTPWEQTLHTMISKN